MPTRTPAYYGVQPGWEIMRSEGRTIAGTSRAIDVPYGVLRTALLGIVRPNEHIRERLPEFLGRDLTELFTEDAIREPNRSDVRARAHE